MFNYTKKITTRSLFFSAFFLAILLAGCSRLPKQETQSRHYVPLPSHLVSRIAQKGLRIDAPILMRAFKKEGELEVWKQNAQGQYVLLKIYPVCRWSGQLGPKIREGDRQVPEGFYSITTAQLNPQSRYYLSFNIGYPNAYDKAQGRTGSQIMVHGACSSRGCFSMTNAQIAEIYALAREAFAGGQTKIQFHSLPFRFTHKNLARYRADSNMSFWKMLKEGNDSFLLSRRDVAVSVCEGRYVFNRSAVFNLRENNLFCEKSAGNSWLEQRVKEKSSFDVFQAKEIAALTPATRRLYVDGDQHAFFRSLWVDPMTTGSIGRGAPSLRVEEISRLNALRVGPSEVPVTEEADVFLE